MLMQVLGGTLLATTEVVGSQSCNQNTVEPLYSEVHWHMKFVYCTGVFTTSGVNSIHGLQFAFGIPVFSTVLRFAIKMFCCIGAMCL